MANFGRLIALAIALWLGLLLYISTFVLKTEGNKMPTHLISFLFFYVAILYYVYCTYI